MRKAIVLAVVAGTLVTISLAVTPFSGGTEEAHGPGAGPSAGLPEPTVEKLRTGSGVFAEAARVTDAGLSASVTHPVLLLAQELVNAKRERTLACVEGDPVRCENELFEFLLGSIANDARFNGEGAVSDSEIAQWMESTDFVARATALAALRRGEGASLLVPASAIGDARRSAVERVAWGELAMERPQSEWTTEHQASARELARSNEDARLVRSGIRLLGARGGVEASRVIHELPDEVIGRGSVRLDAAWALSRCGIECLRNYARDGFRTREAAEIFVDAVRGSDFEQDPEAQRLLALALVAHAGDHEMERELHHVRE